MIHRFSVMIWALLFFYGCGITLDTKTESLLVTSVKLERYAGLWYQVARYPHAFQNSRCGDSTAEYALLSNGSISVLNRCWETTNGGRYNEEVRAVGVAADSRGSFLKVTFFGLFTAGYLVIALDTNNYQWAAVTTPDRNTLWVLSRTPSLEEPIYSGLISNLAAMGFDPGKIIKTSRQK